jgi:cytochrome c-type biogenesis protein CcmE
VKPKYQRLILAVIALFALIGAVLIAMPLLNTQASYFYTPTTLAKAKLPPGKSARLGGMVQRGSIKQMPDGVSINFVVQDRDNQQKVFFRGIPPALFVEGSGVVADGRLQEDGTFVVDPDGLLAKHDENYVPRELADIDMNAAEHTQDTLAK